MHIAGRACARPGLVPRVAQRHEKTDTTRRGYADHLGTDAPRKPRRTPNTTHPQFYHDLITMRGLCRHTWERTHAITLNTTPVPPCKIFIIIRHSRIYTFRKNFDCKKCPVHLRWYRLSNITDYSFHTLWTFLTVKNVTLTWYRLPNITVYSFHTLSTFLFF
mgnify:CR=1 FL=1